jgi:hypothetical protein
LFRRGLVVSSVLVTDADPACRVISEELGRVALKVAWYAPHVLGWHGCDVFAVGDVGADLREIAQELTGLAVGH